MNILPNRLLGVVGEHEDFPVENLSKSRCENFLASCSHDQKVKFWNIKDLPNVKVDASKKDSKSKNKQLTTAVKKDDFFSDMMENKDDGANDGDSGDESSDEDDSTDFDSDTEIKEDKILEDFEMNSGPGEQSDDSDNSGDNSCSDNQEDPDDSNSDSELRNGKKDR